MKRSLFVVLLLVGALSGGFLLLDETIADARPGELSEEWVNANLVRVRYNGKWETLPLVPLAEHTCRSGNGDLLKKHCEEQPLFGE